jgi:hypothetical protein
MVNEQTELGINKFYVVFTVHFDNTQQLKLTGKICIPLS